MAQAGTNQVVSVAVGRDHVEPLNPRVALGLAIVIAVAVFVALMAMRKTFGLKR
jgi:hypothetical protein